jgi:hypothetical protein
VQGHDAGAASAIVNTSQQIGGSIGTALLNTIYITVSARALMWSTSGSRATTVAYLHGYSVAFWWSAGFFGLGTIITLFLLESGATQSEPALLSAG